MTTEKFRGYFCSRVRKLGPGLFASLEGVIPGASDDTIEGDLAFLEGVIKLYEADSEDRWSPNYDRARHNRVLIAWCISRGLIEFDPSLLSFREIESDFEKNLLGLKLVRQASRVVLRTFDIGGGAQTIIDGRRSLFDSSE